MSGVCGVEQVEGWRKEGKVRKGKEGIKRDLNSGRAW